MNISEKAKTYAEGKALEFITKTIEKAYEDGYRQGYADRDSEIPEDLKKDSEDGVEYVDLGLPSGTLWAKDFLKEGEEYLYLTHNQASKKSIPTKEQWEELKSYCRWFYIDEKYSNGVLYSMQKVVLVGRNGARLEFNPIGKIELDSTVMTLRLASFWITDKIYDCGAIGIEKGKEFQEARLEFCGFRLPIRLVKNK